MSRVFRDKNKDLVNLKVVTSSEVHDLTKKDKRGRHLFKDKYDVFGCVNVGSSAFVSSCNKSDLNHRFIEDTSNLPKKIKNDIVKAFKNENRKVVYLVKDRK